MADYTNSKFGPNAGTDGGIESARQKYEPLITPDQLKTRHLFGVSLASASKDPLTGKLHILTDDIIQDIIDGAVSTSEEELKIDIFPIKRSEKLPFDNSLYASFGYMQLSHRPCASIDKLSITPSSEVDIFVVPNSWIEVGQLVKGQINIVPLLLSQVSGTYIPQSTNSGGVFWLSSMTGRTWIASWFKAEYTSGFIDGMLPRVINEYIGTVAAMEILSMLATTYARTSSHSLGVDGLSQSASGPGSNIFTVRMGDLENKKKALKGKIKAVYMGKVFSGAL
jgi:hypothetical protein